VPPPPNSGGLPTNQTLVSLNCDEPVASATSPGNSLGQPRGPGRGGGRGFCYRFGERLGRPAGSDTVRATSESSQPGVNRLSAFYQRCDYTVGSRD
jgi:hypothetical protein